MKPSCNRIDRVQHTEFLFFLFVFFSIFRRQLPVYLTYLYLVTLPMFLRWYVYNLTLYIHDIGGGSACSLFLLCVQIAHSLDIYGKDFLSPFFVNFSYSIFLLFLRPAWKCNVCMYVTAEWQKWMMMMMMFNATRNAWAVVLLLLLLGSTTNPSLSHTHWQNAEMSCKYDRTLTMYSLSSPSSSSLSPSHPPNYKHHKPHLE